MSTTVPGENFSSSNPPIPPKSTDLSSATTSRNRHAPIAPPEAIEEVDQRNRDGQDVEQEMEEVLILSYTADHVIRLFIPVTGNIIFLNYFFILTQVCIAFVLCF